jgi:hypothetical protein
MSKARWIDLEEKKIHPLPDGSKYDGLVVLDVECRDDDVCEGFLELQLRAVSRLGQRHGYQSTTLTSFFYKNIYWKVIYVYSYESNFQNKSICIIFTFSNSTT